MKILTTLMLLLLPAAAGAIEFVYRSAQGPDYFELEFRDGLTLQSLSPQTYHLGAAGVEVTGIETLRLESDCTATSALLGAGFWMQDSDGFAAVFRDGAGVSFPGQAPPLSLGEGCGSGEVPTE